MTGRRRLTWVTALTIASLLLGSGALNALAEGRGGGDGHGDHGRSQVVQQAPISAAAKDHGNGGGGGDHGNGGGGGGDHGNGNGGGGDHGQAQVQTQTQTQGKHEDNGDHGNAQNRHEDEHNNNANVQARKDDDADEAMEREDEDEDLVTAPVQETEEVRPGLGCGDDNHRHSGPPGNPGKTCPHAEDDNDQGVAMNNDDNLTAATVDDDAGD